MNRASEFIGDPATPTIRQLLERSLTFDADDFAFILEAENALRNMDGNPSAAEHATLRRLITFLRDIRRLSRTA